MAASACLVQSAVPNIRTRNARSKKPTKKLITPEELPTPAISLFLAQDVLLGWREELPVGAGMTNVGNSCYVNSTLQALFHTPAFVNWLLSDRNHITKCGQCITCAMARTLTSSHTTKGAMRPHEITRNLNNICRTMSPGQQEDAHEFLRCLLQGMERAYLERPGISTNALDALSKETTPINGIFGGYIRTEVKCTKCFHVSTTIQHFQDISVDIVEASTINEALDAYFRPENIEEYQCEGCQRKVLATKKFSVVRAPKVLCLQLKRFTVFHGKITRHIGFHDTLNVGPYVHPAPSSSSPSYRLTSIISHIGASANSGHYIAAAQGSNGQYYSFDDTNVRAISRSSYLSTNAYVMVYELLEETTTVEQRRWTVPAASASPTSAVSAADFLCEDPEVNAIVMAEFEKMAISDNSAVTLDEANFPALGGGRKSSHNSAPKPRNNITKKPFKKRK